MIRRQRYISRLDNGLGGMLALSLALHLVLLFFAAHLELFRQEVTVADAIYVDVLNMPVAAPQAGSPVGSAAKGPAAAPPPPPQTAPPEMKVPQARSAQAAKAPTTPPRKEAKGESSREFDERMKAIEQAAEARQFQQAMTNLQKSAVGGAAGRAGMPGGTGNQAGSDYAAYIQSRLRDAFEMTIAWQTKKPQMVVRLFIDAQGRLIRYKVEKSTGDPVFEDAVDRAIQLARKKFPPPPGGKEFNTGFVFKPQGVDQK